MASKICSKKYWQVSEYVCEECGRFFWMPIFLDYLHCPYCENYVKAWNNDDEIIIERVRLTAENLEKIKKGLKHISKNEKQ